MTRKGITLIEMVSIIVVLSLAIPILLTTWADVAWRSSRSELVADTTFYVEHLMEEIKSKRFDENTTSPWTSSGSLGVDAGETRSNKDTFDDVDDFMTTGAQSCTDTLVTNPATGYTRSVTIDYVYLNGTTWQACNPQPPACGTVTNCSNCNQCCYKRITVKASHNLVKDITLVTIVSGY